MGDALPVGATISLPGASDSSASASGAATSTTTPVSTAGHQNTSATEAGSPGRIGKAQPPSTADLIHQINPLRGFSCELRVIMLIFGIAAQAFPAEVRRSQIIKIVVGGLVTPIRAIRLHGIASPLG